MTARKRTPMTVQMCVLHALILRDIRTRFFGNGLGFIIAVGWPLSHILLLISVYALTGRGTPYGDSLLAFFAISLVPMISFMYISRWMMLSSLQNRPLLNLPPVKILDIVIARAVVEIANYCLVVLTLMAIVSLSGTSSMPYRPVAASVAFICSILVSISVGFFNAMLVVIIPFWSGLFGLVIGLAFFTSAVAFIPSQAPTFVQSLLIWNPVFHCVEYMRYSYYLDYDASLIDLTYVVDFSILMTFLAALMSRIVLRTPS